MKKLLLILFSLMIFPSLAFGIEIVRQKNVATYIMFPIVDSDGDVISSAAGLDSEIFLFQDGSINVNSQCTGSGTPWPCCTGSGTGNCDDYYDCTNEATEIGSSGVYYLSIAQTESNIDYAIIRIKTTSTGGKTQHILIRTTVGDPLNLATTDDGGDIVVDENGYSTIDFDDAQGTIGDSQVDNDVKVDVNTVKTTDADSYFMSAQDVQDAVESAGGYLHKVWQKLRRIVP